MAWKKAVVLLLICILTGTVLTGCASSSSGGSSDKVYEARFASVAASGSFIDEQAKEFIRLIEEKTGGRLKIKYFPDGQLGTENANMEALKTGTLEMSGFASTMPLILPEFAVFDLPYLITSREQMEKFLKSDLYAAMKKKVEEKGFVIVSCSENGFRHITDNKRPIVKPEDLVGLKIRTPSNPARLETFKYLKAIPTPISFSELFQALQQGVVDGQENPLAQIYGARLYEAQKYLSLSSHIYTPSFNVVSKLWWDTLPEDIQKAIIEAGDESGAWSRQRGAELDEELLIKLEEEGLAVNEVDLEAFKAAMQPLIQQLSKDFEPGFIDKFLEAVN